MTTQDLSPTIKTKILSLAVTIADSDTTQSLSAKPPRPIEVQKVLEIAEKLREFVARV